MPECAQDCCVLDTEYYRTMCFKSTPDIWLHWMLQRVQNLSDLQIFLDNLKIFFSSAFMGSITDLFVKMLNLIESDNFDQNSCIVRPNLAF